MIVIDDGSTDDTGANLLPYIEKQQIIYIRQENKGVSAARNAGIQIAKGEWIACLDSDDLWLPDKLSRQMNLVDSCLDEMGCVICNIKYERPIGRISDSYQNALFYPIPMQGICENMSSILLTRFLLFNQGSLIRKVHLNAVGGYDEHLDILEDYDLALKLSYLCVWGFVKEHLVLYQRDSGNSLSSRVSKAYEMDKVMQVYDNLTNFLRARKIPLPDLLLWQMKNLKIMKKYQSLPGAGLLIKVHGYLLRHLPSYPKPIVREIEKKH